MKIEDILKIEDIGQRIAQLKKRVTIAPDVEKIESMMDPKLHDVMNPEKRKNGRVLKKEAYTTPKGQKIPAEYEDEPVTRIALPIEEDIVNIHTAFTVGIEPKLYCETEDDKEKAVLDALKMIYKKNKLKYQNKRIVRSWLSEQEVAEYWYTEEDDEFWKKVSNKTKGDFKANRKLKSVIWSPLRGDKLYPKFERGNLVALSREYQTKDDNDEKIACFMTITKDKVYTWKNKAQGYTEEVFDHKFTKMPVIYAYRPVSLVEKIQPSRNRLEELLSDFGDCIKQHFFPKLILEGDLTNEAPVNIGKTKMIKLENNGKAYYLDWSQTPEMVKVELENHYNNCYSLTNTPRISFDNLKGMGAQSGVAFKYTFMGTHMEVENHYETIGEFMQRRVNFLQCAIGNMNTYYEKASVTADVESECTPYMIEDFQSNVETAVSAFTSGVASRKEAVILAGIVDDFESELEEIEKDLKNK